MENLKRKMNCLVYDEDVVDEDNNVCMFVVVADNFPRKNTAGTRST